MSNDPQSDRLKHPVSQHIESKLSDRATTCKILGLYVKHWDTNDTTNDFDNYVSEILDRGAKDLELDLMSLLNVDLIAKRNQDSQITGEK